MCDTLYSTTEAGNILGVATRTIVEYTNSGRLDCVGLPPSGKKRGILESSLRKFIRENEIEFDLIEQYKKYNNPNGN